MSVGEWQAKLRSLWIESLPFFPLLGLLFLAGTGCCGGWGGVGWGELLGFLSFSRVLALPGFFCTVSVCARACVINIYIEIIKIYGCGGGLG